MIRATILAIALQAVILTATALGQQASTPPASTAPAAAATTPKAEPPPAEYVEVKGFKSKVLDVKNRDPRELMRVLAPLGSGFRGATMVYNDEFRTITVRDWPENIATIEDALARLDLPAAAPSGAELHVHILVASMGGADSAGGVAELSDVLSQLH
ncbi:MAG TPA: secretin N-terminal domain-containing protein, partial [Blastocatellia bacterium]